jgi:hypothetical protein
VFVGNLPWGATEEELREFFGGCGAIRSVRIGEAASYWGLGLALGPGGRGGRATGPLGPTAP